MSIICRMNNLDTNIPTSFLSDHFAHIECFSFELLLKTKINRKKSPIILSKRRKIPISRFDVSSRVISFNLIIFCAIDEKTFHLRNVGNFTLFKFVCTNYSIIQDEHFCVFVGYQCILKMQTSLKTSLFVIRF